MPAGQPSMHDVSTHPLARRVAILHQLPSPFAAKTPHIRPEDSLRDTVKSRSNHDLRFFRIVRPPAALRLRSMPASLLLVQPADWQVLGMRPSHQIFRRAVRTIACCGVIACLVLFIVPVNQAADDGWRRTGSGWQHVSSWQPHQPRYAPPTLATQLHPATVACFELLAAVGLLVAFGSRNSG